MRQYVTRRLLLFVPTLLLASIGIFLMMRVIPGDVAQVILGGDRGGDAAGSQEQLESLRRELGLSDPLPVQYAAWAWSMVNGEFGGKSLIGRDPLSEIIARRWPVTFQTAFYAIILAVVVSIPFGVIAAVRQDAWPDYLVRLMTISGTAVPNFWLALVAILVLAVAFEWTPPLRYVSLWQNPFDHLQKVALPVLVLSWGLSSNITRITRSSMLEVMRQDYIRTARSKGLQEQGVLWRHALRNALIPVITLSGLQLAGLLSGTVILENIFGLPGIGQGIVLAAMQRDLPVVQSLAMILVFTMLCLNLVIDLMYSAIDPRIKYS
ncbi:MAG: ABC transporter permease [Dehalococcoidia bacterium]|nr:ABC transporter permease [Dehalococcoidia bacterium]